MQSFWLFQRRDNNEWDVAKEEIFSELPQIIAGSLHIIDAENRAKALATKVSIEKVIRRIFDETVDYDNEYIYHK